MGIFVLELLRKSNDFLFFQKQNQILTRIRQGVLTLICVGLWHHKPNHLACQVVPHTLFALHFVNYMG